MFLILQNVTNTKSKTEILQNVTNIPPLIETNSTGNVIKTHITKCSKIMQHVATRAHLKQTISKCREMWPFCENPVCPDPVWNRIISLRLLLLIIIIIVIVRILTNIIIYKYNHSNSGTTDHSEPGRRRCPTAGSWASGTSSDLDVNISHSSFWSCQ